MVRFLTRSGTYRADMTITQFIGTLNRQAMIKVCDGATGWVTPWAVVRFWEIEDDVA